MSRRLLLLAAVLAVAGCSSAATSATPPAASSPARAPAPAATSAPVASPSPSGLRNILVAPAQGNPSGPEHLTFLSCGKLTAAQQTQFGTNASAGFAYRFVNATQGLTAAPKLEVNFLNGSTVVASNVTGSGDEPIGAGQSGFGEVDGVGASGQPVTFDRCEVMSYGLVTSTGVVPTEYAG